MIATLWGLTGSALAATPTTSGDITITEFMAEPTEVPNYTGEWFELYNASDEEMDLSGLDVRGDTDTGFTISGSLILQPGEYALLGVGDCSDYNTCGTNEYNGGIELDYLYDRSDFSLDENGDTIRLVYNSVQIDAVVWESASWVVQKNYAHQANVNAFNLEWANNLTQNWCAADTLYGDEALYGTPGSANPPCDDSNIDDDGDGYTEATGDCDDTDPYVNPDAIDGNEHDSNTGSYADGEGCCGHAEDDADCDGVRDDGVSDQDGDGYTEIDGDCDESDATINPGAVEVYDKVDDDCNGCVDDVDDDGDGLQECPEWVSPFNTSEEEADYDCDDDDENVNTLEVEIPYDAVDNDCDGYDLCDVDGDGYLAIPEEVCPGLDEDGDGVLDCCALADYSSHPDGAKEEGDCDDNNSAVNPGATEGSAETGGVADGVDNDCNGTVDDPYQDQDGDGYASSEGDCNDNPDDEYAPLIHPGAEELCDDFYDNDCDGLYNDGCENRGRYASLQGGSLCGQVPSGSGSGSLPLLLLLMLAVGRRVRGEI